MEASKTEGLETWSVYFGTKREIKFPCIKRTSRPTGVGESVRALTAVSRRMRCCRHF